MLVNPRTVNHYARIPRLFNYVARLVPYPLQAAPTSQALQQHTLASAPLWGLHATMPPKQATLGYVKSSQQTLGCMLQTTPVVRNIANRTLFDSKFFGNPQGAKSKPQQSTLAFNPAQSFKAEKSKDPKVDSTNGSVMENGTEDAKNREDDGDVGMGGNSGTLKTISKEPALKVEKSKSSRDKILYSIESTVADENIKDGEGV